MATSVEDCFRSSVQKFTTRLTKDEEQMFRFTTLDELRRALGGIQEQQRKKKEVKNLNRLQAFLDAMKQFGEVVEVFLNASEFVCFIWGPMKFLLQAASTWVDSMDILLNAYEQLADNIPLLQQYGELFGQNIHMQNALSVIYEDILEFHRKALRIFSRRTLKQILHAAWNDFKSSFKHILEDLERHKKLIESQATLAHYRDVQKDRDLIRQSFKEQQKEQSRDCLMSLMDWLSGSDVESDHNTGCSARSNYPNSGKWLQSVPVIKTWVEMDNPPNPVVWIHGIPGAGKTVLMSSLIEECLSKPDVTILYFYCKHDDSDKKSFASIVRTMISQAVQSQPDILLPVLYQSYLKNYNLKSTKSCQELFQLVLQTIDKTYIFVDGLDECKKDERQQLISCFNRIIEPIHAKDPGKCRILYASQDESDIRKSLTKAAVIAISSEDVQPDIDGFIQEGVNEIKKKFGFEQSVLDQIQSSTSENSRGMFIYAKLIMDHLYSQLTRERLLKELEPHIFPDKLETVYVRIAEQVYNNPIPTQAEEARRLLSWIVCAKRPMKWTEIQGAIAIDAEQGTIDVDSRGLLVDIKELCGSLAIISKDGSINLVHSTARHYLIKFNFVPILETEFELCTTSMQYLTFQCFDANLTDDEIQSFLQTGSYAFQSYAACFWNDHLFGFIQASRHEIARIETLKEELETTIETFVHRYPMVEYPETDKPSNSEDDGLIQARFQCQHFQNCSFLETLVQILANGSSPTSRDIDTSTLTQDYVHGMTFKVRKAIELYVASVLSDDQSSYELTEKQGDKLYFCPRTLCYYFHHGFLDGFRRDQHHNQHERPYHCVYSGCFGVTAGFSNERQLKKHSERYHPNPAKLRWEFQAIGVTQPAARTWDCPRCTRKFTRNHNLQIHMRRHTKERPYSCGRCFLTFSSANMRNRHEATHSRGRLFVCGGNLSSGARWGCGWRYRYSFYLEAHLKSTKGCITQLRAEEERKLGRKIPYGVLEKSIVEKQSCKL